MTSVDTTLAVWARSDAEWPPWMAPYRAAAMRVAAVHVEGRPLAQTLTKALAHGLSQRSRDGAIGLRAGRLRFVQQHELPASEPYEAFIARTACVPTRDNLHDLFNALVWLTFPVLKRRLNELQSQQIATDGIRATRGAVRDALTVFDENAAWWQAPSVLVEALRKRDWHGLFITHRAAWQRMQLTLFGHALLEKLTLPRKNITAHVWLLPPVADGPVDADLDLAARLTPELLATRTHLPLPVLGVPGWWPGNEAPGFYADASVFRPAPRGTIAP